MDPNKKAIYDKYGLAGLKDGSMGGGGGRNGSPADFARDFFRGFGGFNMPLVFQLDLSLEDFYNGREFHIPLDQSQQIKVVIEPGMTGNLHMLP